MAGHVLVDLLVILIAAKVAAEVAERFGIPAVLGEIAAGVVLGPAALGVVEGGDVLQVIGEIGVILLLLEVGMEMDLRELAQVGRASLIVAVGGMVLPFATGWAALTAIGQSGTTTIFVAAALTATSVGITARAFGDMGALASVEARVVIGAAVADDVLGLIVLTVVARIAEGQGVSGGQVVTVIAVAIGFLVLATATGLLVAPGAFALVDRWAGSPGTLVAMAFVFTLGFAELAQAAELAPIVGAFVAGLSLSRSTQAPRIRRELAPLGHLFIPVFFFLIGTEARLDALADVKVLGIALLLSLVAVAGKVAAGWGARGTSGDRLLVGLGMVPRGEVGLIFATIGRTTGVLDDDLYAALLVVVLLTTVITPPLLRWRHKVVASRASGGTGADPPRQERPSTTAL
jgi:Kef-type K+ transport system membrane component KefB